MALDVGAKRIGAAMTDAGGTIAQPLTVLERKGMGGDVARIFQLVRDNEVRVLVFGVPYDDNGRPTEFAAKILELKEKVAGLLKQKNLRDVKIETWDETMTTCDAHERLKNAGIKHSERKGKIDMFAALVILESWMEGQTNPPSPPFAKAGAGGS
jgi:putative Holliday junction resolvase